MFDHTLYRTVHRIPVTGAVRMSPVRVLGLGEQVDMFSYGRGEESEVPPRLFEVALTINNEYYLMWGSPVE